ncbi:MAG: sigma-70 family RNA polymerase sigma factor [Ruminococcus sp.]|nr:sigma-70 family RNA polymerase sigma factor [Ruminococcus sp.]
MEINDGFSEVYERNVDSVYRICLMHLRIVCDAEDATQAVFMKYLKNPRTFSDCEHEKAWFIVAARNHCRDMLRCWWRAKRSDICEVADKTVSFDTEEDILLEKLMALPPKYKEVLYLYYYEEYSVKEISELIGRNESTIRTQLSVGRERLKIELGGYINERQTHKQGV